MRISTLTFQFAHNYGAMLQAYALKQFLVNQGNEVDVAPYYPSWASKEYACSPFEPGISLRKRVRFLYQYPVRRKLVRLFDDFRESYLHSDNHLRTVAELESYLSSYDIVIYGSDQIWNNRITGDASEYYGNNLDNIRNISYAASLGTQKLSEIQKENIRAYLPMYHRISVRETQTKKIIELELGRNVDVVCDPVFLLEKSQWKDIECPVKVNQKYLIVYFLQRDETLLNYALEYAKKNNLHPYVIHPTLASAPEGCTLLRYVGPREFVWLIDHAECVCTNSFHAVSFSVIFEKKLFHIPNKNSPERTISLLEKVGIRIKKEGEVPFYVLSSQDYIRLERFIDYSKAFLNEALNGE